MKWFGYILFIKASGITQNIKNAIINISCCQDNDQCTETAFRDSLLGDMSLVRIEINKQGADLLNTLNTIDVDSYTVYGNLSYYEGELMAQCKNSILLANEFFDANRVLFEVVP